MATKNYIRIGGIASRLAVCEAYAWRKLRLDPTAPKPIRLGARLTVFDVAEVDAWIAGLAAAATGKPARPNPKTAKKTRQTSATV